MWKRLPASAIVFFVVFDLEGVFPSVGPLRVANSGGPGFWEASIFTLRRPSSSQIGCYPSPFCILFKTQIAGTGVA